MSDVMTLEELRKDVAYWQRLMRFHGYDCGKIDGIRGAKTRAAEAAWDADAKKNQVYGVFDERTERNLATVCPEMQRLVRVWLTSAVQLAQHMQYEIKIIEGTRSYARQNELKASGRGVTNAKGGQSWHNFGLAVDFGVFRGKSYILTDEPYRKLGALARGVHGLEWGGDWKGKLVDTPHVQLKKYAKVADARVKFEALA